MSAGIAAWATTLGFAVVTLLLVAEVRRRAELVARGAHELRRPLGAARLALEVLEREGDAPPAELGALDLELRRAGAALDDMTAAARGRRAPGPADRPVDISALLAEQVDLWRLAGRALRADVRLGAVPPGLTVLGDRDRLARAVANLLANAVEHGGGTVTVSAVADADGTARIVVADRGPGLPAGLGTLTAAAGRGAGLRGRGLAITAAIARAHGGRLGAEAQTGGAALVVELPPPGARSHPALRAARRWARSAVRPPAPRPRHGRPLHGRPPNAPGRSATPPPRP